MHFCLIFVCFSDRLVLGRERKVILFAYFLSFFFFFFSKYCHKSMLQWIMFTYLVSFSISCGIELCSLLVTFYLSCHCFLFSFFFFFFFFFFLNLLKLSFGGCEIPCWIKSFLKNLWFITNNQPLIVFNSSLLS